MTCSLNWKHTIFTLAQFENGQCHPGMFAHPHSACDLIISLNTIGQESKTNLLSIDWLWFYIQINLLPSTFPLSTTENCSNSKLIVLVFPLLDFWFILTTLIIIIISRDAHRKSSDKLNVVKLSSTKWQKVKYFLKLITSNQQRPSFSFKNI